MSTFVCLDANEGTISRWEAGGQSVRLTHRGTFGGPVVFRQQDCDTMRRDPPDHLKIGGDDPRPTSPNATAALAVA